MSSRANSNTTALAAVPHRPCRAHTHPPLEPVCAGTVGADGYYVLTDFGLCAPTGASSKAGTKGYWSPETVRKQPQTAAADWWSLGVVLAYAAMGTHPFHVVAESAGAAGTEAEAVEAEAEAAGAGAEEAVEATTVVANEVAVQATAARGAPPPPKLSASVASQGRGLRRARSPPILGGRAAASANSVAVAATPLADADAVRSAAAPPHALAERQLNHNTLHLPVRISGTVDDNFASFLHALLERDAPSRLGAPPSGVHAVQAHAFLREVEWDLLERKRLPAPFVPNRHLVYAKDEVEPLADSVHDAHNTSPRAVRPEGVPTAALGPAQSANAGRRSTSLASAAIEFDDSAWEFAGLPCGLQEEMEMFVEKCSTAAVLRAV